MCIRDSENSRKFSELCDTARCRFCDDTRRIIRPHCGSGPRTESRRNQSSREMSARWWDRTVSRGVLRFPPGPLPPGESGDMDAETSLHRMYRREPESENRPECVLPTSHLDSRLHPIAHGDCG